MSVSEIDLKTMSGMISKKSLKFYIVEKGWMNETDFHVSFSIFGKVDTMSYDNGICGEWNPARFEPVTANPNILRYRGSKIINDKFNINLVKISKCKMIYFTVNNQIFVTKPKYTKCCDSFSKK